MAKQKQQGSPGTGGGMGSRPGDARQGQGETARDEGGGRFSDAQQEQGGERRQEDGDSARERADERLDADAQSGSSPRATTDAPDDGKVG